MMLALLVLPWSSGATAAPPEGGITPISSEDLRSLVTGGADRSVHPSGVRVVNFWATWCPPCVAELPVLVAWAARHPEVQVALVNVDLPSRSARVSAFLDQHGLRSPAVLSVQLDSSDPAGTLFEVVAGWPDLLPVTLVNRPDGSRAGFFPTSIAAADLDGAVAHAARPAEAPLAAPGAAPSRLQ